MNINGKTKIYVSTKEGVKRFYTILSSKYMDDLVIESYDNVFVDVVFNKKKFSNEVLEKFDDKYKYEIDIKDGFLIARHLKNKNIAIKFVINEATCLNKIERKELREILF